MAFFSLADDPAPEGEAEGHAKPVQGEAIRAVRVPWERLPNEPPEAFEWFSLWLRSGESVSAWAREVGCGNALALSARYTWRPRRAAYVDALALEAAQGARDHARALGAAHASALAQARASVVESIQAAALEGKRLSLRDAVALLPKIVEAERLVAGEHTAKVEIRDLSALSDSELALIESVLDRTETAH